MLLSPRLQKLHVDSPVVCHWMVFLKTRPFVKWNNAEFANVSSFTSFLMCSTHFTQSCRILFLLPTTNNFFKFVYSEITGESAWQVLFGPLCCCLLLWQLKIIRIGLTSILDFWYPGPSYLMQEVLVLYFLYLVSCTQKMRWREHSLADTVPLFSTILQFSLELSKNWVLFCPVYALYEFIVLANSIRLLYFCVCFPLSSLRLQLLCHGSYLSFTQVLAFHTCTIMSPFLHNADFSFFKCLPSPSRSCGMFMRALIEPQTLTFLSSDVWANLTLL